MFKRLMITLGALAMIFSPAFAQDTKTKVECFTPEYTITTLTEAGVANGVDVELVFEEKLEEGLFIQYFWKHTETVLAVAYIDGCAVYATEISLADFKAISGLTLAST